MELLLSLSQSFCPVQDTNGAADTDMKNKQTEDIMIDFSSSKTEVKSSVLSTEQLYFIETKLNSPIVALKRK